MSILWKLGGAAIVLGVLWAAYGSWHHSVYNAGKAEVQAAWDKDKAGRQAIVDAAVKQQQERDDAIIQANAKDLDKYRAVVADAASAGLALARRLRDAERRQHAAESALSEINSRPGAAAPGADSGDGPLTIAVGAALAECTDNAAQLNALSAEVRRNQPP
jgi:DNA primase